MYKKQIQKVPQQQTVPDNNALYNFTHSIAPSSEIQKTEKTSTTDKIYNEKTSELGSLMPESDELNDTKNKPKSYQEKFGVIKDLSDNKLELSELVEGKGQDVALTHEEWVEQSSGQLSSGRSKPEQNSLNGDSRLMNGGNNNQSNNSGEESSSFADAAWGVMLPIASAVTGFLGGIGNANNKDDTDGVIGGVSAVASSVTMKVVALGEGTVLAGAAETAAVTAGGVGAAFGIGIGAGVEMAKYQVELTEKFKLAIGNYFECPNPNDHGFTPEQEEKIHESLFGSGSINPKSIINGLNDSIIGGGYNSEDGNNANYLQSVDQKMNQYRSLDEGHCFTGLYGLDAVVVVEPLNPMESSEFGFLTNPGEGGDNGGNDPMGFGNGFPGSSSEDSSSDESSSII
jgi:hypothetical protein